MERCFKHCIEHLFNRGCKARTLDLFWPSASFILLIVNLALMIPAGAHLVPNLIHVGPDHEEEVGAKYPPGDVDHCNGVDEVDYSQDNPRPHEADTSLKFKYIAISRA